MTCAVGKVCTCTHSNDSVQYVCELLKKRKHRRSFSEFSEFNLKSIEFWDSEQHNEGSQESGNRRSQNKQPGTRGKRKAGILAHQSDLYPFHLLLSQRWWYWMSSVLVEADYPVATGLWRMLSTQIPADNPSRCSCAFIHHVVHESTQQHVLDCGAAADFQILFGVEHPELIADLLRLSKIFIFTFLC